MFTKDNTKIFIDSNIFLGLYNSNESGKVNEFMKSLFENKDNLIITEHSYNEYLRNRTKLINESKNNFSIPTIYSSSYIRSFPEYDELQKNHNKIKEQHKKILEKINLILLDPLQDDIYTSFIDLWDKSQIIPLTDKQFKLAFKRKMLGAPPGNEDHKKTCCDEVIWESLISTLNTNLIIVSKDQTYKRNREYLQREYQKETNQKLEICDKVHLAFSLLNIKMNKSAIAAENSIMWPDFTDDDLYEESSDNEYYELDDELHLKCKVCDHVFDEYLDFESSADERSMGYQITHVAEIRDKCPNCSNSYYIKKEVVEYPEGCFTEFDFELEGVIIPKDRSVLHENQTTFTDERFSSIFIKSEESS